MIQLPYPPTVNHIWKITKGGKVYKSSRASVWAQEAGWIIKASGVKVQGPFILSVIAYRPDKRRRDVDNIVKVVMDALQASGAVADDCDCQCVISRWAGTGVAMHMTGEAIKLPVIHVEVGSTPL